MTPGEAAVVLEVLEQSEPFTYTMLDGGRAQVFRLSDPQREALAIAVKALTTTQEAANAR